MKAASKRTGTPKKKGDKPALLQRIGQFNLPNWRRQLVLFALFVVAGILLTGSFYRQVTQADKLIAEGNKRYRKIENTNAVRGSIYDRNGNSIAVSVDVESIAINPKQLIHNPYKIALLAHVLERDPNEFYQAVQKRQNTHFLWIARHISPKMAHLVRQIEGDGISLIKEYKRYYPDAEITSHLLGFTNIDDEGIEGVELSYDEWLSGTNGKYRLTRDGRGRLLDREVLTAEEPGRDLTLTIDRQIQIVAYRALKAAVIKHKAKGGTVVVANAKTGEILAMVNQPAGNPNRAKDRATPGLLRNRAITDVFEPGSTMKPFVVATGLESGKWRPDTTIKIGSYFRVGRHVVRDVGYAKELDVASVLIKSSNIGVAKIALSMDPDILWRKYKMLGIAEKSHLGLVGEVPGTVTDLSAWKRNEFEYATKSFGYGLSVNTLKLAQMYTVFANKGVYKPLRIVRSNYQLPETRVFSPESAETVLYLLEDVLNKSKGGSGWRGQVDKFRVAGKSGTVRKLENGRYSDNKHRSFFVGIAPVTDPEFIIAVMIDEPTEGGYYGGLVAAPVFSEVMGNTLRIMGIRPDGMMRMPKLQLISQ